jgi:rhamnogalacturonan endolyase
MPFLRKSVLFPALLLCALPIQASVRITREARRIVLANNQLSVTLRLESGRFSLSAHDRVLVNDGYWSQVGRRRDGRDVARTGLAMPPVLTIDPASNGGERGEVSLRFAPGGAEGGLPCEVEMRYTLDRDSSTLFLTSVWRHGPGMPGFSIGEARHAMKLNGALFDYLAVDEKRHGLMPSGADWDRAEPLNLKEARRIVSGPFAGKAEHKYGYSAMIARTPAYGWASSKAQTGVWLINPSSEYLAGGPVKMELTGHLDVNRGGTPVLLNMWHGSHYGGSSLNIADNEVWSKVIGPFAVHVNAGAGPEALWRKAIAQSAVEEAAWPYSWLRLPEYPDKASRGSVKGVFQAGTGKPAADSVQIGLAAAPATTLRRGRSHTVDWQRNSRDYQFWTTASPGFEIPNIRPGEYTLYAIADGRPGEFSRAGIRIEPGQTLDLGTLVWQAETSHRTLWQIGKADRSAGEFCRGNEAGTWGLYYQFQMDFPEGVNFTIGISDPAKDWNYAHCGITTEGRRGIQPATWNVHFDLPEVPGKEVSLRLGIAGNRSPSGVMVGVNGQPAGTTGPMPDTAVMHRDAVRGAWFERRVPVPPGLLKPGRNTLSLTVPVESWPDGVLYDFVRLEVAE